MNSVHRAECLTFCSLAVAALCSPAAEKPTVPVKRRRVTAEMEGKYIVHMPKGTTPRTKKILEQQAAKGTAQRPCELGRLFFLSK